MLGQMYSLIPKFLIVKF